MDPFTIAAVVALAGGGVVSLFSGSGAPSGDPKGSIRYWLNRTNFNIQPQALQQNPAITTITQPTGGKFLGSTPTLPAPPKTTLASVSEGLSVRPSLGTTCSPLRGC